MLTKEDNELLTMTGPETEAGAFMRSYWQPIALSADVPEDGAPRPVRVLGEDLVLYRSEAGAYGLLRRWCAHRGTDLGQGWVEGDAVRCPLHGWLYDMAGHCLEQPLEPPENNFCAEIHQPAYPCTERGGVIFAYLGAGEAPILPEYECLAVPDAQRAAAKYLVSCNYLQALEGNVDPAVLGMLLRLVGGQSDLTAGPLPELKLEVEPEDTVYGLQLQTLRELHGSARAREIRNFLMPNLCLTPAFGMDGGVAHWHVPIDDTSHWHYVLAFRRDGTISEENAQLNGVEHPDDFRLPSGREALTGSLVAYATLLAEGQGPIYDRSKEELAESDRGIVAVRAAIYGGIVDVREGADPRHVVRDAAASDFRAVAAGEVAVAAGES